MATKKAPKKKATEKRAEYECAACHENVPNPPRWRSAAGEEYRCSECNRSRTEVFGAKRASERVIREGE